MTSDQEVSRHWPISASWCFRSLRLRLGYKCKRPRLGVVPHLAGVPHLPEVPHLHVNRPSWININNFCEITFGQMPLKEERVTLQSFLVKGLRFSSRFELCLDDSYFDSSRLLCLWDYLKLEESCSCFEEIGKRELFQYNCELKYSPSSGMKL